MSARTWDGRQDEQASAESACINRRNLLKKLGGAAAIAALPQFAFSGDISWLPGPARLGSNPANSTRNPRWYGFNLLEYFSTDADWMKYFPYKNDGMFLEDDFRWIRDWGFNWVRLPMDYRFWTDSQDFFKIREDRIAPIDRSFRNQW